MSEPDQATYYLVSACNRSDLTRRFVTEAEALAFAATTANRHRLRLLVARYDPAEPDTLCTIVAEFSGELPF
jgi:hypothetical protein